MMLTLELFVRFAIEFELAEGAGLSRGVQRLKRR